MKTFALSALLACTVLAPAMAADCPGNPDALGTSRTLVVDPAVMPKLGSMQYHESLPLAPKEVVLTFDDGPLPPMTGRVLDALAHECVKATFFSVGRMARAYPHVLQRVAQEGHTIASHSQNHPLAFNKLSHEAGDAEIINGYQSVAATLAPLGMKPAPFFRFPGLGRNTYFEQEAGTLGLAVMSADFPADDWTHISGDEVMKRALERLEKRGSGVLLLHDIQPATATMLPQLLRELKARGYSIVHIVPPAESNPAVASLPIRAVPVAAKPAKPAAPAVAAAPGAAPAAVKPVAAKPAAPKPVAAAKPATADVVSAPATTASTHTAPAAPQPPQPVAAASEPLRMWPRFLDGWLGGKQP